MYTYPGRYCNSLQKILLKTFTALLICSGGISQQAFGQFTDNFADGDFTSAPAWTGTSSKFLVTSNRLKLQAPVVNDQAYLSTPNSAINDATWEFYVRLEFNPSSGNYARVYLTADHSDLSAPLNGYFVGVGNASDEISLYRQTGSTITEIIDGLDNRLNVSTVDAKVKVTRDALGNWSLFSDVGLTSTYSLEGSFADVTHPFSAYFGVYCLYTSTRSDKFYFDDFAVSGNPFVDTVAPNWLTLTVSSATELKLTFSEELEESDAENILHFEITGIGHPASAVLEADNSTITLDFAQSFPNGIESQLVVTGVTDTAGNALPTQSKPFLFFQASPVSFRDVIISEVFPDPGPKIGLPEAEFIELYNRSENPIQLQNWTITDGSSLGVLGSTILLPGHYIILSSSANEAQFSPLGKTVPVTNFPTLNNGTDGLKLQDNSSQYVDSVRYTDDWYKDEDKKQGGWSLEMIDPENICKGADNWRASQDATGGTPGKVNSIYSQIIDLEGPHVLNAIETDDHKIEIELDEKLDGELPFISDVTFVPEILVTDVAFKNPELKSLIVQLENTIEEGRTYKITVANIHDCPGNVIAPDFASTLLNPDAIAPTVDTLRVISSNTIEIEFSEKVSGDAADETNYALEAFGNPSTVSLRNENTKVKITFSEDFKNGVEQKLFLKNFSDINGNVIDDSVVFMFFQPSEVHPRDIIITEIFADPAPVIGLPEVEFVEIFNRSENPIDLKNWNFTDGTSTAVLKANIILPGQYFILSTSAAYTQFAAFGKTIALTNFPTLNNSGDVLVLKNADGVNIDSLKFSSAWYRDDDKKQGGWSLELIDTEDICKGSLNWKASLDTLFGGTPGKQNSVFDHIIDNEGPTVSSIEQVDSVTVRLTFDEKLDNVLPAVTQLVFDPPIGIDSVQFGDGSQTSLNIFLSKEILKKKMYSVTVRDIYDCPGNKIEAGELTVLLNPDTIPPLVSEVIFLSANSLEILFSEQLSPNQATAKNNFTRIINSSHPASAVLSPDGRKISLIFSDAFGNGVEEVLRIENLQDINENKIAATETSIMHFESNPVAAKDIIITEIFPDPSPVIGLPEAEFVELYNRSRNPVLLKNWTLTDGSSVATFPSQFILPGQYVILSSTSTRASFVPFGKIIGLPNFPTLNNSADILVLKSDLGVTIDSLAYADSWYGDDDKKAGGYTLELIDTENICAEESNWIASEDETGGTPGRQNSVFANKPDVKGPALLSAIPVSESKLLLRFDEKLSRSLPINESFQMEGVVVQSVKFGNTSLRELEIVVQPPIEKGLLYKVEVNNVFDCAGNEIDNSANSASFGLPENPSLSDIVINEVLFNPRPTGVDFIEMVNHSGKFLNLKNFKIGNMENDTLRNLKNIIETDFLFKPGDYLVLTTDPDVVKGEYVLSHEENFFKVNDLPSLNDEEGSVAIADSILHVVDFFEYANKMHSVFLKDDEGVSLERVDMEAETNNVQNWKSASQQNGFATPGYINSNSRGRTAIDEEAVLIEPEIFQPQSGQSDFAKITYHFDSGGFIANVKIFDPSGRQIKELASNVILNTEGFFRWDGDEDNGSKASVGSYMVWFQVFNDEGVVQTFKKRVAVAGKF
jgi:hypothetical protein